MMKQQGVGIALLVLLSGLAWSRALAPQQATAGEPAPYLLVLGIAQDGGIPQAGTKGHSGWTDPASRRLVTSLALVDPVTHQRWLFDATPDFREQLHRLDSIAPAEGKPGLAGILLTHAHIGHYTGLMHLGHEAMGAEGVPVYAMPGMRDYLRDNGPWSQLVHYGNIEMQPLEAGVAVQLNERLSITPFLVPHRQEYSEVVGFRIQGPSRAALFIPDIDSWEEWEAAGTRIEEMIARVDIAYLDGTFFANGEIPGRDMSGFPHPFITHSMSRFDGLAPEEKAKVRFIHLNHTNPVLWPESEAYKSVLDNGFRVAEEGEREGL
jgi:pyrroloquinoline quinone biosynthesis protein B